MHMYIHVKLAFRAASSLCTLMAPGSELEPPLARNFASVAQGLGLGFRI